MDNFPFNTLGVVLSMLWCVDIVLYADLPPHVQGKKRTYPGCGFVWWIKRRIALFRIREWKEID